MSKVERNVFVRVWELGPARTQEVRIASIVGDPPGDDLAGERVVVRNDRRRSVVMSGWVLHDASIHRFTFPNFTLSAGENVTVWTKRGMDDDSNVYWGRASAVWNNRGGDTAILLDNAGNEVARLTY